MAYRSPVAAYANPSPSSVPDQFSEIICELRPVAGLQNILRLVPTLLEPFWDLLQRAFENNRFVSRKIRLAPAAARQ
jgi:hypothetical protein